MKLQATICFLLQLIFEFAVCTHLQVIPGSSLELPCLSILTEFTTAPITWTFNGKNVTAESPGSTTFKKDGLYLSISTVTAVHEGQYVCLVKGNEMEIVRTYDIAVDESIVYYITAATGSTIQLPCSFRPSTQVLANAEWFKETGGDGRIRLNTEGDSTDEEEKVKLLYPLDEDQTIIVRNVVLEDAGIYKCESAAGQILSTVHVMLKVPPTPVPHSCGEFAVAWEPCIAPHSHTGELILQESMLEFSMKLYSSLRESQPSSNLLFSPLSINMLLSHLLLGARGATQRAIESAVCIPNDFHCIHFQMRKLREKLTTSLQMASQIYYNPRMNLSESFTDQSIQFYEAVPTMLLETSEENTKMINSWVANKTNNKIKHLVDSVSPSTQLMLLNAVSFSGQWNVSFDVKPRKGFFSKLNGDLVKVPILYHQSYPAVMMQAVDLKAQVARFALTGGSSLYILLPRSNTVIDLQQVEKKLTDRAVLEMLEKMKTMRPESIEVTLPQIKLDVQPDMYFLIKKLGLSSLFEDANLCGLYTENRLVLTDARHRAFLALNEEGVEAGAVTSVSFSRTYSSFTALQPFIMMLWSDQANVPLFIGRVTDP